MIGGTALTVSTNMADKNLTMENSFKTITEPILKSRNIITYRPL